MNDETDHKQERLLEADRAKGVFIRTRAELVSCQGQMSAMDGLHSCPLPLDLPPVLKLVVGGGRGRGTTCTPRCALVRILVVRYTYSNRFPTARRKRT